MTDEKPKDPKTQDALVAAAIRLLDSETHKALLPLVELLRGWKFSTDPAKREGYTLMVELAGLEEQRRERTWKLTRTFAPPAWRKLLDASELPDNFDAWAEVEFRTLLHQGGISAGQDVKVPSLYTSTPKLIKSLPPETEATEAKFKHYSKRAYYQAAVRCWGAETDARLTALALSHGIPTTELIDKS